MTRTIYRRWGGGTVPAQVTGLTATVVSDSRVDLSWDVADRASTYTVYRNLVVIATGQAGTTYSDVGVSPDTAHYYTVAGVNNKGAGRQSAPALAITLLRSTCGWRFPFGFSIGAAIDATAPSVPAGLQATAVSDVRIDLTWNASSDSGTGVSHYRIFRGDLPYVDSVTTTSFSDTGLAPNSTYPYRVSAVDVAGNESARSSIAQATTMSLQAPAQVTGLAATAVSSSTISLSWNAAAAATSYTIRRGGSVIASGVAGTTYSNTGLSAGTQYSYTVAAANAGGEGQQSAAVQETTQAADPVGRIMFTKFSSGISLVETASYSGSPGGGGEQRLDGTDSVTGDTFTATTPAIWGGYNTGRSAAATIQTLSAGATSLATALATHNLSFENGVAFTNPITQVSGTQRALKIYRTDGYDGADQDSFQLYPNTALPQGMFYVRGTVKFNTNFFTNYGLWGCTLSEAKTNTERRVILSLANYNNAGWMVIMSAENTSGASQMWTRTSTPGVSFLVNNCLTFEFAARYSTGSGGWAWAAINGSSTFGGQTFQVSGANLPPGDTGKINRLFPFLYYNGFSNGAGANNPQWFLSTEVWEAWPTDASAHPAWS